MMLLLVPVLPPVLVQLLPSHPSLSSLVERCATPRTGVGAVVIVLVVDARTCRLGALLAQDAVLHTTSTKHTSVSNRGGTHGACGTAHTTNTHMDTTSIANRGGMEQAELHSNTQGTIHG